MTPNEIYELPAEKAANFHYIERHLLADVFAIEGFRGFDPVEHMGFNAVSDLMLMQKLSFRSKSDNHTSVSVLEFKGVPFAVVSSGSADLHDIRVTNATTFAAARDWVIVQMNDQAFKPLIVSAEKDIGINLHGAAITRVDGKMRMLSSRHIGLHSGVAIFDEEVVRRRFRAEIAPLQDARHFDMGVLSPEIGDKAVDIILAAAIADRKVIVGERVDESLWLAGFFLADGETYAAVVGSPGLRPGPHWSDQVEISRVGYAPMFELIEEFHAHGRVNISASAAKDYAAAFGLSDIEASMAIGYVAQTGHDFLTAAVKELQGRHKTKPSGPFDGAVWTQARLLTETPALARYGLGMTASLNHARQLHNRWLEVHERNVETASRAP